MNIPQYALVTGSAKGIGKAIANELAQRQYHLLLVDFDQEVLEYTQTELRGRYPALSVHTFVQDLSEPEAVANIEKWLTPFKNKLKVAINNAGFGLTGRFTDLNIEEQLNMVDVNFKAVVRLSYLFVSILKNNGETYLLNVASTTAYQSVPYLAVYAASKAAVLSFTRSLRFELRETDLSVSTLSPGSTDTAFVNRARMGEHTKKTASKVNMTPEAVGKIAVKGLFAKKSEIIPGFLNVLNAHLPKYVPKILTEKVAANIYEPRN
ncbi:MAG: SDR family NAD(P)-dependent oxidoreductase [Bacteroidetes bacterium]|nr:SDR family NAD(P)-dependent oxidoreductase [Bacteroidota bacterium]